MATVVLFTASLALWHSAPLLPRPRIVPSPRTAPPCASEAGRLMRVATPPDMLEELLDAALRQLAPSMGTQERRAAVVLQQRLELTPEQTCRLLLKHPQVLDHHSSSIQLDTTLDVLQACCCCLPRCPT